MKLGLSTHQVASLFWSLLCVSWLPRGVVEVADLNPHVPVAIRLTEGDEAGGTAAYAQRYTLRISYTQDADIQDGQVARLTLPFPPLEGDAPSVHVTTC